MYIGSVHFVRFLRHLILFSYHRHHLLIPCYHLHQHAAAVENVSERHWRDF
jgi:hypothetical protein